MRAIILAAGKGERLGTLSQKIPKPMLEFKGKPLLIHNIELCSQYNIKELYINVHHLADKIINYFWKMNLGVSIKFSVEKELLGTAGATKKISDTFWGNNLEPFFVLYGDNYSNFNLNRLKQLSEEKKALLTIGFHYREDVTSSGVAEFDSDSRVIRFIEKPKNNEISSHWVNAGIYYCQPSILKYIPNGFSDFSRDCIPFLIDNKFPVYGICENSEVKAFDTVELITKNNNV